MAAKRGKQAESADCLALSVQSVRGRNLRRDVIQAH
jgi:hypothetical protein